MEYAAEANSQVTAMARQNGLTFNLDKAVVANTFNAHRFIHLAAAYQLGSAAEEELFKAYFTGGKDVNDEEVLVNIGKTIGLDETVVCAMLQSDAYAADVHKDELQAQSIGIRGVPFFIVNNKYAVSGAQPSSVFLQALQQAWQEYAAQPLTMIPAANGDACAVDGSNC